MRRPLGPRRALAAVPFPGAVVRPEEPRVPPASRRELGFVNGLVCAVIGRATGGEPPNVFTTLGRNRRLFRAWLRFAGRLMPFGSFARAETELVILRVAVLCGSDYEWQQHVALAQRAGVAVEEIERVAVGADAPGWTERERLLLRATDELTERHVIAEATWAGLRVHWSERQLIELCFLAGQYAMLAGTLSSLGVQPERTPG